MVANSGGELVTAYFIALQNRNVYCPKQQCLNVGFRMVGGEITLATANPTLDVKVSLPAALQCLVMGY